MKTSGRLKKTFGIAKMVDILHVRYLSWVDAFDVAFELRYDTCEVAEVSWAFIRDLPPKKQRSNA